MAERAPQAAVVVTCLLDDPAPLVAALVATPQTFVPGDWKACPRIRKAITRAAEFMGQ